MVSGEVLTNVRVLTADQPVCPVTGCGRDREDSVLGHLDTLASLLTKTFAVRTGTSVEAYSQKARTAFARLNMRDSFEDVLAMGIDPQVAHPLATLSTEAYTAIVSHLLLHRDVRMDLDPLNFHRPKKDVGKNNHLEACRVRMVTGDKFYPVLPGQTSHVRSSPFR